MLSIVVPSAWDYLLTFPWTISAPSPALSGKPVLFIPRRAVFIQDRDVIGETHGKASGGLGLCTEASPDNRDRASIERGLPVSLP